MADYVAPGSCRYTAALSPHRASARRSIVDSTADLWLRDQTLFRSVAGWSG